MTKTTTKWYATYEAHTHFVNDVQVNTTLTSVVESTV